MGVPHGTVTAEVVLRSLGGGQPTVYPGASDTAKMPPYESLAQAFPPTRITISRGTWAQFVYFIVTLPFNALILMPLRVVIGFACLVPHMMGLVDAATMMCWFCRWSYKVRVVNEDGSEQGREVHPEEAFKWASGRGATHTLSKLLKNPGKTVFALEHHICFIDGAVFKEVMRQSLGGAYTMVGRGTAKDGLMSKAMDPRTIFMYPGDRLCDGLGRWRQRSDVDPKPLVIFPAATTSCPGTVIDMQPRMFELLEGDEEVRPVAIDYEGPTPQINHRGLGSSNFVDCLWYAITPCISVTVTVLPPIPDTLLRAAAGGRRAAAAGDEIALSKARAAAAECAAHCERAVTANGVVPKRRVAVSLFHKRAWERVVVAADWPGFKAAETAAMVAFQRATRSSVFRWIATVLHFATLEPALMALGALLLFTGAEPAVLFGPMGRALALNMVVMHVLKMSFRYPRPAWAKGPQLPNRPQQMRPPMASHEWSMPSGHAGFMGCVWGAAGALCATDASGGLRHCPSSAGGLPAWAHAALALITVLAAASRVWLSLHWPSDVVVGAAVGGAVGYVYCAWMHAALAAASPAWQAALALAVATVFVGFSLHAGPASALEAAAFQVWSAKAQHPVNPSSRKPWILAASVFTGMWLSMPLASALLPLLPTTTLPHVAVAALPLDARAALAAAGLTAAAAAVMALLLAPQRALARARAAAERRATAAARASRSPPGACPVVRAAAARVTTLSAAADAAFAVGVLAVLQAMWLISDAALPMLAAAMFGDAVAA